MPLTPNAIYKGLFRKEKKKKVLPIKTPVRWSELTDDVVFAFLFLWGLWRFC